MILTRDGVPHLLMRVGNLRCHTLYSPRIRLTLLRRHVTQEGESYFRRDDLVGAVPKLISARRRGVVGSSPRIVICAQARVGGGAHPGALRRRRGGLGGVARADGPRAGGVRRGRGGPPCRARPRGFGTPSGFVFFTTPVHSPRSGSHVAGWPLAFFGARPRGFGNFWTVPVFAVTMASCFFVCGRLRGLGTVRSCRERRLPAVRCVLRFFSLSV